MLNTDSTKTAFASGKKAVFKLMSLLTSLKHVGVSTGVSYTALDATSAIATDTSFFDGDTKKLIIAGLFSVITQVLLKLVERERKRKTAKTIEEATNGPTS